MNSTTYVSFCFALLAFVPAGAWAQTRNGSHDFDFLAGRWKVHHHQLKGWLVGSHEWRDFEGTCDARLILGGQGNLDDNVIEKPEGTYRAASIRCYDTTQGLWRIWWLDARYPQHIDVPVAGSFKDGVGTFYGDDSFDGKPIRMRFQWTRTATAAPRWEQAFSSDGGKSWETNWIMDFTRAE